MNWKRLEYRCLIRTGDRGVQTGSNTGIGIELQRDGLTCGLCNGFGAAWVLDCSGHSCDVGFGSAVDFGGGMGPVSIVMARATE